MNQTSSMTSATPLKNLEFPALSQMPRVDGTMPPNNPVDQIVPEKFTPVPPGQEDERPLLKDLTKCIPKTEEIISNGYKQVKHVKAITLELKLLLEHEQTILEQVITRIDKFKNLRDENKRKATEWENEYKSKLPEYDAYATKLVNVPQSKPIAVEGLPAPIQQKILYQIVSRTSNTADRVVVSLSMEQTVANDIDLTLGSLKKQCTVILKRIRGWLKMLNAQEQQQDIVLDRWDKYKQTIKDMKKVSEERTVTAVGSTATLARQLKPYEERIRRLEAAICDMGGAKYGTCPDSQSIHEREGREPVEYDCESLLAENNNRCGGPGNPRGNASSNPPDYDNRLSRAENAICTLYGPKYGTCKGGQGGETPSKGPTTPPNIKPNSKEERLERIEKAICDMSTQSAYPQSTQSGYPTLTQSSYPQSTQSGYPSPTQSAYPQPTQSGYQTPNQSTCPQPTQSGYPAPTQTPYPQPTQSAYPTSTQSAYPQPTQSAYPTTTQTACPQPTRSAYPSPTQSAYPQPTQSSPYNSQNYGEPYC